jgi:hypothetical protein
MVATCWIMGVVDAADAESDRSDAKSKPMMIAPIFITILQSLSIEQCSVGAAHCFGEIAVIALASCNLQKQTSIFWRIQNGIGHLPCVRWQDVTDRLIEDSPQENVLL